MQVTAKLNYLRIAPRKMRLLADLVRGKKASEAMIILNFNLKKGGTPLKKLIAQAVANAKDNPQASKQLNGSLFQILKITVDEGPKLKRWRARARGRAARINKKTSHITITLDEIKKVEKGKKKKKVIDDSVKKEAQKIEKTRQKVKESKNIGKKKTQTFRPEKEQKLQSDKEVKDSRKFFRRKAF